MDDELRRDILRRIDESEHGKLRLKISTALEWFGFSASARVRKSSLDRVCTRLEAWGIACHFPSGDTTIYDWVTLSRGSPAEDVSRPTPARSADSQPRAGEAAHATVVTRRSADPEAHPFTFVFEAEDPSTAEESASVCADIFAAVWSSRPVCLLIAGADEFFYLAGGVLAAVMRRRAQMIRTSAYGQFQIPLAPEILSIDALKRIVRQYDDGQEPRPFPTEGAVYLVRDLAAEVQEDELTATLREMFVPQTYHLKARFATTAADPGTGKTRARDAARFDGVLTWIAAYAGVPGIRRQLAGDRAPLVDLASYFAEASQLKDTLVDRATLTATNPRFRSGFEGTEHMVLKKVLLDFLARAHGDQVLVEEFVGDEEDLEEADESARQKPRASGRAKPDLRVPDKVWVEVETLRSISFGRSNPFFALEAKMRRKLQAQAKEIGADEQVWLVVPSDVAALALPQMAAVVRNLRRCFGGGQGSVELVQVDLEAGAPVFIDCVEPRRASVALTGASWRPSGKRTEDPGITWDDVAGYSQLKDQIRQGVLDPILNPERYARHGLTAPNSLLLYGLPGCGKTLVGRVMAAQAKLISKRIAPSDLTSMWLGEGVAKIRELFDWAIKQPACLIVIDEIDGIAPQRSDVNMHSDEKRQVNELLAQLDRIAKHPVTVVGTTNYVRGIDIAVRRSGRFDVKVAVFPPREEDRREVFRHYLTRGARAQLQGAAGVDFAQLAAATPLFTPADIATVVNTALRGAVFRAGENGVPRIDTAEVAAVAVAHPRSITREAAEDWLREARAELGASGDLDWLAEEIGRAFGGAS